MPPLTPEARVRLANYLDFQAALGIDRVRVALPLDAAAAASAAAPAPAPGPAPGESLADIQNEIGPDCRRCKLCRLGRHTVVFGEGDAHAELLFVGEGPGADEDQQGRPFVGRAGQLLNDMIEKGMGLRRGQVYIANVVKCRPPENRTPENDEIAACLPFLIRQILAIQPKIICALGSTAAQALRPYKGALGGVRGVVHPLHVGPAEGGWDTHLAVTYHPAYLLRDPAQKKEAWKDLQLVMRFLGLPMPTPR